MLVVKQADIMQTRITIYENLQAIYSDGLLWALPSESLRRCQSTSLGGTTYTDVNQRNPVTIRCLCDLGLVLDLSNHVLSYVFSDTLL